MPGENPLRVLTGEATTNSTPIWCQYQDLNLRATMVGGECSHHCTTQAPLMIEKKGTGWKTK